MDEESAALTKSEDRVSQKGQGMTMMNVGETGQLRLGRSLAAWSTPDFEAVFKHEVAQIDIHQLPLQQGLAHSSSVADEAFSVILIRAEETVDCLRVRAGILYAGIVGGCNCADDPSPLTSQPEYCELWFEIDRASGAVQVRLSEGD